MSPGQQVSTCFSCCAGINPAMAGGKGKATFRAGSIPPICSVRRRGLRRRAGSTRAAPGIWGSCGKCLGPTYAGWLVREPPTQISFWGCSLRTQGQNTRIPGLSAGLEAGSCSARGTTRLSFPSLLQPQPVLVRPVCGSLPYPSRARTPFCRLLRWVNAFSSCLPNLRLRPALRWTRGLIPFVVGGTRRCCCLRSFRPKSSSSAPLIFLDKANTWLRILGVSLCARAVGDAGPSRTAHRLLEAAGPNLCPFGHRPIPTWPCAPQPPASLPLVPVPRPRALCAWGRDRCRLRLWAAWLLILYPSGRRNRRGCHGAEGGCAVLLRNRGLPRPGGDSESSAGERGSGDAGESGLQERRRRRRKAREMRGVALASR